MIFYRLPIQIFSVFGTNRTKLRKHISCVCVLVLDAYRFGNGKTNYVRGKRK